MPKSSLKTVQRGELGVFQCVGEQTRGFGESIVMWKGRYRERVSCVIIYAATVPLRDRGEGGHPMPDVRDNHLPDSAGQGRLRAWGEHLHIRRHREQQQSDHQEDEGDADGDDSVHGKEQVSADDEQGTGILTEGTYCVRLGGPVAERSPPHSTPTTHQPQRLPLDTNTFVIEPKGLDRPIQLQLPIMIATYPARNKDGTLKRRGRLPAYPAVLPVFRN
ncbi:arrestin domain-containing protein 4 [Trichonephila clavata]|uniref:Arrestin domain-containing protein 4 n=1 Tax=Trichonephila clavata TaxID=2740835 RepID=A0A8X6IWY4_TRICU|nr:arrestin domain-containing protein 4 [Trichonephila clavata]